MNRYQQYRQDAYAISDWIVDIRRTLHRHPELMYEEFKTSELVRAQLSELGISFKHPIAETGVLASVGTGDSPCVALRADMDALPILEETDVEFRSETDGKMHACGHDCHTAMLLGAARVLKAREAELKGTVKFLFQPAEEGGAGGKRMCDAGVLERPSVQRVFGLHCWPQLPVGSFGAREGVFLAASSTLRIVINGVGGHAAMPNLAVDPVATAAKVITELQTIVSRELDPLHSGVVSITMVHGGTATNVIPDEVVLEGTVRALSLETLNYIKQRVEEIVTGVAASHRCTARVNFPGNDYPPTLNDGACWDFAQQLAREMTSSESVVEIPPVMGGEDFAFYTQHVPGVFVGLGVRNEEIDASYSVHHPKFKVDEEALPLGSALHVAFAMESLEALA